MEKLTLNFLISAQDEEVAVCAAIGQRVQSRSEHAGSGDTWRYHAAIRGRGNPWWHHAHLTGCHDTTYPRYHDTPVWWVGYGDTHTLRECVPHMARYVAIRRRMISYLKSWESRSFQNEKEKQSFQNFVKKLQLRLLFWIICINCLFCLCVLTLSL